MHVNFRYAHLEQERVGKGGWSKTRLRPGCHDSSDFF